MAVHFMFAASKEYESVPVAGGSIALGQLKDEIYNLKFRAGVESGRAKERFDFRIFDAESKEEILGAHTSVPRHSRVLVKRVPAYVVSEAEKQQRAISSTRVQEMTNPSELRAADDGFGDDVFSTPATSCVSNDWIKSSADSATSNWTRSSQGAKETHLDRKVVRNRATHNTSIAARVAQKQEVKLDSAVVKAPRKVEIPRDIACSICHDIMKDAVLIPCCCTSFCRNCVTLAILAHQKCPSCSSSKCKDSDLLPNRSLNASVDLFLKANGIITSSSQTISHSSSAQSGVTSEHARSESTNMTDPMTSNSVAATSDQRGEKRKMAPLCISLGAKRTKPPLNISLSSAKVVKEVV